MIYCDTNNDYFLESFIDTLYALHVMCYSKNGTLMKKDAWTKKLKSTHHGLKKKIVIHNHGYIVYTTAIPVNGKPTIKLLEVATNKVPDRLSILKEMIERMSNYLEPETRMVGEISKELIHIHEAFENVDFEKITDCDEIKTYIEAFIPVKYMDAIWGHTIQRRTTCYGAQENYLFIR